MPRSANTPRAARARSTPPTRGTVAPSVLGRGDLATALLFVFPLFLAYEVGVLFSPTANGVDYFTRWVFRLAGSRRNYLIVHGALAVGFLACLLYLRRHRRFSPGKFPPMLLESAIYALTCGTLIIFLMQRVLGLWMDDVVLGETGEAVVSSLGAGVHEELVFRLGLLAGSAWLLRAAGAPHAWAVAIALVASSLAFSAAHHVGTYGEPWTTDAFVYRALAGAMFGAIFYFRSLAHAVYTHFLYDVYVLLLRS